MIGACFGSNDNEGCPSGRPFLFVAPQARGPLLEMADALYYIANTREVVRSLTG